MLVTTPGRLFELLKKEDVTLRDTQAMVLDEVDVLFQDTTFPLQPIGQACPLTTQFVFTSATLPQAVLTQISSEFPSVQTLQGPGLHRVAPAITETLIDCSGKSTQTRSSSIVLENKQRVLLKSLLQSRSERTLIFCNTIEQCRRVENFLEREDRAERVRKVYCYHSAIDNKVREENLIAFSKPLLKVPVVMICTDRASRGMDFDKATVDHVILFDFPKEPSEYLRRVGRTGRAGRTGSVTVLVYGKQVPAARAVIQASLDGKKIEPENARSETTDEQAGGSQ